MTHIHPLACVDATADIDSTAIISAFSVIEAGVQIGSGTVVGPLCHIRAGSIIGAGCEIHSGAVIGDTPQDRAFTGQPSGCVIGDGSIIREQVTVHRGTAPGSVTQIGRRCLIMAGAHVGHNCAVEDDVTLVNGVLLGGYVQIGARAVLSGHVAVHQFVRIGKGAMVGVLSPVTQDVIPYFMIGGSGLNVGINRIGLRRMGANRCEFDEAQRAFRVLCREHHSLSVARQQLEAELVSPVGLTILSFLASDSPRGFHLRGVNERSFSESTRSSGPDSSPASTTSPESDDEHDR